MLHAIFFSIWFFAPAGFANLAAFLAGKIKALKKFNYPVDCYKKFHGRRVLGNHKTFRGFVAATLVGILVCSLEVWLYTSSFFVQHIVLWDYSAINPVILGALLGFGALFGDSVKSFFKRQINIPPGESWFPFDQIDYVVGGVAFSLLYIRLPFTEYIVLFIVGFLVHPLITFIGYLFRLRKQPL
jgi:CDP-2,3-bis-(O-geranylgeranyl)-sn-glycerol synthase